MAILHQAQLVPTKLELLQRYLPTVDGLGVAEADGLAMLGPYRFDDPAGEVGIETHFVSSTDGRTLHIPVTYRSAPEAELDEWFIGTVEHSVLGTRWCYDGVGDPVYQAAVMHAIATGGTHARLDVLTNDGVVEREPIVHVRGSGDLVIDQAAADRVRRSGSDTAVTFTPSVLTIHHVVGDRPHSDDAHLAGTWPGVTHPQILATVAQA